MIEKNINKLGITIPDAPAPVGAYVAFKFVNKLLFISGQISVDSNGRFIKGKVGKDIDLKKGQEAAKLCAINIIAQAKKACSDDLEKISSCIKLTGFVNSSDEFIDQPKIINGASDMIVEIFGENGKHSRFAVGTNSLPLNFAVEIEAIVTLKE